MMTNQNLSRLHPQMPLIHRSETEMEIKFCNLRAEGRVWRVGSRTWRELWAGEVPTQTLSMVFPWTRTWAWVSDEKHQPGIDAPTSLELPARFQTPAWKCGLSLDSSFYFPHSHPAMTHSWVLDILLHGLYSGPQSIHLPFPSFLL